MTTTNALLCSNTGQKTDYHGGGAILTQSQSQTQTQPTGTVPPTRTNAAALSQINRMNSESVARAQQSIAEQLKKQNLIRNKDVRDLYLSQLDLTEVCDLSDFKNLRRLWLNQNRLRFINFLPGNFRLSELHISDNSLVSIANSLRHLTGLQTLSLNNNQLARMEETVSELANMHGLQNLNLFHNPLTSEPQYRSYVIHHLPQVIVLDRSLVMEDERLLAKRTFAQDRMRIEDSIGFGRLIRDKPKTHHLDRGLVIAPSKEIGNHYKVPPMGDDEKAAAKRANQRTVMEFTRFDWSKVPLSEQKRTTDGSAEDEYEAQLITVRFQ